MKEGKVARRQDGDGEAERVRGKKETGAWLVGGPGGRRAAGRTGHWTTTTVGRLLGVE
jgi:hypothetical protein